MVRNDRGWMKSIIKIWVAIILVSFIAQIIGSNSIVQKSDIPISNNIPVATASADIIPAQQPQTRSPKTISKDKLTLGVFSDAGHGHGGHETGIYCSWFIDELAEDCGNSKEIGMMDFAISVGDLGWDTLNWVDGDPSKYPQNFQQFIEKLNVPWFCALGNHDIIAYDRDPYRQSNNNPYNMIKHYLNETSQTTATYAVCKDNILFLFVGDKGSNFKLHNTQYEWLEYMTTRYHHLTTVIVTHQGIWETTYDNRYDEGLDYTYYDNSIWWAELFSKNPQIKLYLFGHSHYYDYVITNKTGSEYHKQGEGIGDTYYYDIGHDIAFICAPILHSPPTGSKSNDGRDINEFMVLNISADLIEWNIWRHDEKYIGWFDDPKGHPGKPNSYYKWYNSTTFDPNSEDWYSIPVFLQDEELQILDNHIISDHLKLELIGTGERELFTNPHLDHFTSFQNVGFPGFRGESMNQKDDGIMREKGKKTIHFPSRYLDGRKWDGGKSGQLKNSIFCGTTPQVVPGKQYDITITARAKVDAQIKVICNTTDWSKKSQYCFVPGSEQVVIDGRVGPKWTTLKGTYTAPNNDDIWFICGRIELLNSTNYYITSFSIQRSKVNNNTKDFHMYLNGIWYNQSGELMNNAYFDFPIEPTNISNNDGTISFKASIDGSKVGMARLIYYNPILVRGARVKINEYDPINDIFEARITEDISSDHWKDLDIKILPLDPVSKINISSSVIKSNLTGNLRKYFQGDIDAPINFSIFYEFHLKTMLISPPDGTIISNNKPTFEWRTILKDSSYEVGFQVLISNKSDFQYYNFNSGEQFSINSHWQFPNHTYYTELSDGVWYWKVRVKDNNSKWGDYSRVFSITIDTTIEPPSKIIPSPNKWTATNLFNITWDNPNDISGISGLYYKLDNPPTANNDGTYIFGNDINSIHNLTVNGAEVHKLYIWLIDGVGNIDFNKYNYRK